MFTLSGKGVDVPTAGHIKFKVHKVEFKNKLPANKVLFEKACS